MVREMRFEAKGFFDLMVTHCNEADTVNKAEPHAPQIQPEFISSLMSILINPPDLQHPQNVSIPEVGSLKSNPVL